MTTASSLSVKWFFTTTDKLQRHVETRVEISFCRSCLWHCTVVEMAAQGLITAILYTAKLRQSPERYSADCSSAIERPLVILKLIFFGKNNADIRIKTDALTTLPTLLYSTTPCRVEDRVSRKVCLVSTRDTIGTATTHDVLL